MNLRSIDYNIFKKPDTIGCLTVPNNITKNISNQLMHHYYLKPNLKPIHNNPDDASFKDIYLRRGVENFFSSEIRNLLNQRTLSYKTIEIELDYSNYTFKDALEVILPEQVKKKPTSYDIAGHIAYFQLRKDLLPYKETIGKVLLDKIKSVDLVVNKSIGINSESNGIKNDINVIAFRDKNLGVHFNEDQTCLFNDQDFEVSLRSLGCKFEFNLKNVYWNSRLSSEYNRLIGLIEPFSVVCDVYSGIGTIAIPLAKKGCKVYANDLNPIANYYLKRNVKLNRVSRDVSCSMLDANEFIEKILESNKIFPSEFILDFPAQGLEILKKFKKLSYPKNLRSPKVHVYYFKDRSNSENQIIENIEDLVRNKIENINFHFIKNISAEKELVHITLELKKI